MISIKKIIQVYVIVTSNINIYKMCRGLNETYFKISMTYKNVYRV